MEVGFRTRDLIFISSRERLIKPKLYRTPSLDPVIPVSACGVRAAWVHRRWDYAEREADQYSA